MGMVKAFLGTGILGVVSGRGSSPVAGLAFVCATQAA